MLTPEQIANLPPDTKKEYMQTALLLNQKKKDQSVRDDFMSFVKYIWPEFIEGEHHKIMADKFNKVASGEIKRLIINMAPRHTKSEFASNLLPAWMIGNNPKLKIIQATHNAELAVGLVVKQKQLLIVKSIKKYLTQDYVRTQKLQVNGRQIRVVNTMQLVLVGQSPAVVQTS